MWQFLLGDDTLGDFAAPNPTTFPLTRLFPQAVMATAPLATVFPPTPSAARRLDTPPVTLASGQFVTIMFDISVYQPPNGQANFAETLKAAPIFLADENGNPAPLTPVGPLTPPPAEPANLVLTPASSTITAGSQVTLTASATPAASEPAAGATVFLEIGSGPNAGPLGLALTDAAGNASFTYNGSEAGTDQVQAHIGTLLSNLAAVTWTAGPLDHVTISPSSATIAAGGSQAFTALAFDQFDNDRGDVSAQTTFAIAPNGSCTGATCTASAAGMHTVMATYEGRTASASLNVTGGTSTTYEFQGFFAPIDMSTPSLSIWNAVKAGQTVRVNWLLTLNGAPVADPSSFARLFSYPTSCTAGSGSVEDAIEQSATGDSGLQDNGSGNWQYNWKTLLSRTRVAR